MAMTQQKPVSNMVDLTELVGTQMFKQVAMAQVASTLRFMPAVMLEAGERLVVPGQVLDKLFILLRGRLQVFEGEHGDKPIGFITSGDCVGLSSFIDRQPCHVTIVADGLCRLLALDEDHLVPLINSPTVVSRNLLVMLMKYIREKAKPGAQPTVAPVSATAASPVQSVSMTPAAPMTPAAAAPAPVENHVDPVTGCHNQRWLDETLDRLILRAATDRAPLSIVAVDLVDKSAMPGDGSQESIDHMLRQMGELLRQTVRPTDLLARLQNGTFLVMLPATDLDNATTAAARIREAFINLDPGMAGPDSMPATPMALGVVQMKAFVSGRKLVGDALVALSADRDSIFECRRKAEAEAAAAAEIVALAEAQAREEADAEARRVAEEAESAAKRAAEQAENEAWAKAEAQRVEMEEKAQAKAEAAAAADLAEREAILAREEAKAETERVNEHTEKEAWAGAEVQRVELEMELDKPTPPPAGPATFQPDTPDVVELSDEESAALLAQFSQTDDGAPDAGEPSSSTEFTVSSGVSSPAP